MNIQEGFYYWSTEVPHDTNEITMHDFIDNHLDHDEYEVCFHEGTYAEIMVKRTGEVFEAHASGNGDFSNHAVEFKKN